MRGFPSPEEDRCDDSEVRQVGPPSNGVVGEEHIPVLQLIPNHRQLIGTWDK